MKKPYDKTRLRAAEAVCARIARRRANEFALELPQAAWSRMERLARQVRLAQRRQWHAAARETADSLMCEARSLQGLMGELAAELQTHEIGLGQPSLWDVFREIEAVEDEFEGVSVDAKTGVIAVTVGPIALEGIDLGRFEIRLDWSGSRGDTPYRVIALDPNPATATDDVTHPHVQDEQLCEGEGRAAVRAALSQGRLTDFFQIVSQTLETYAPGAAYVEMSRWHGEPCHDCGGVTGEDDRYYCGRCDEPLCGDCRSECEHCESSFCSDCLGMCRTCQKSFCPYCLRQCSDCGQPTCVECLEQNLCEKCHEKRRREQDNARRRAGRQQGQQPGQPAAQRGAPAGGDDGREADPDPEPEDLVHAA